MHAQVGAIGDHGILVPLHAGTLLRIDQNQVKNVIDVGKCQMDQKIADRKKLNQVKDIYAEDSVLNYATKSKNGHVMKEKILKISKL